jgi:hypothetical protein
LFDVSRARVRRPLLALIALVLALVIGYTVKALNSDDAAPSRPHPTQSGPRQ